MIQVERLKKIYGTHVALRDVTFRVSRGTVVGLLGKNGAGKTTTLRVLAGVLRPSSGRVLFDGQDCAKAPARARSAVGYLPESAPLYPELRVEEHLLARAAQKGLPSRERRERVKWALSSVGAWPLRDTVCAHLSRGMRQRVGLADALLKDSTIMLLDEPTAGLDPTQTRETRELIRKLGQASTVVVSTHVLAEVDAMCDSAIVIDRGAVVAQGTLTELRRLGRTSELVVTLRTGTEQAEAALHECAAPRLSLEEIEPGVVRLVLGCPSGSDLDTLTESVIRAVTSRGIPVREVTRKTATLEQIFSEVTTPEEPA